MARAKTWRIIGRKKRPTGRWWLFVRSLELNTVILILRPQLLAQGGCLVGAPLQGRRVLIIDDVITAGTIKRISLSWKLPPTDLADNRNCHQRVNEATVRLIRWWRWGYCYGWATIWWVLLWTSHDICHLRSRCSARPAGAGYVWRRSRYGLALRFILPILYYHIRDFFAGSLSAIQQIEREVGIAVVSVARYLLYYILFLSRSTNNAYILYFCIVFL